MENDAQFIRVIEWQMLDKKKFFPLSIASSFTVRTMLYPFTLIKTRLQIQRGNEVYKGTYDAFSKILKYEGTKGLYKGFWINALNVVSGAFYILTYENVRHILQNLNVTDSRLRGLIGGGCGSLVGQTIIVPFDVISQRLMMMGQVQDGKGNPISGLTPKTTRSRAELAMQVTKEIYANDRGIRGFYRGYTASLFTYVPSSALWWAFYHFYQEKIYGIVPSWVPQLGVQCTAAVLGGVTTTTIINPLDCIRARLQVQRLDSFNQAFWILWKEEGLHMFAKGLSARVIMSTCYSFFIVLGYETVKRISIKDEYKEQVRW